MYNILLSGVGGQGTVLASKLIAAAAMKKGQTVHTAETIGMAQRGGSVVSHVRIGDDVYSLLIPKGAADVIIAFEPSEAVRTMSYLKKNGTVIVSSAPVKPAADFMSSVKYDVDAVLNYIKSSDIDLIIVDADKITDMFGNAKSLNVALLGAAASTDKIGITVDEIADAITENTKPAFHEQNLKALEFGASMKK